MEENETDRKERIKAEAETQDDLRRKERFEKDMQRGLEMQKACEQSTNVAELSKTTQGTQEAEQEASKPQGRTLKSVKQDLKQARKDYIASVLSHRELLKEQKRIIGDSLKFKMGFYNLVTQLRFEKKALIGAPKGD